MSLAQGLRAALAAAALALAALAGVESPARAETAPPREASAPRALDKGAAPASAAADLVIFNRKITTFRASFMGVSPEERAARTKWLIPRLFERGGPGEVTVRSIPEGNVIMIDGAQAVGITPGDVDAVRGETLEEATRAAQANLQLALSEFRESRSMETLLRSAAWVAGATTLFAAAIFLLRKGARLLRAGLLKLVRWEADRLTIKGAELVRRDRLFSAARIAASSVFWLAVVVLTYEWLSFALSSFPYTRPWGEELQGYLLDTISAMARAIVGAIPNLLVAALILLLARGVIGLLKPLFAHVESGRFSMGWLDADTVGPTRRMATWIVWVFALAMAYPYLPGAQTEAFKGMSVLIGLMISLGASSVVGQAASGMIIMYSRTLRRGEYVRIGDHEGTVTHLGMFTTRIRTGLGEELTIPNSTILAGATKNYSRAVPDRGYVVDTAVSIGYDTPWRQVEAMLVEAARRTPGIVADPAPHVFQTELADFYPVYRVVALAEPTQPRPRAELLTKLHQNIQDVFNEYGVQIMSPHYRGDPEGAKVVPPARWYDAPARRPSGEGPEARPAGGGDGAARTGEPAR